MTFGTIFGRLLDKGEDPAVTNAQAIEALEADLQALASAGSESQKSLEGLLKSDIANVEQRLSGYDISGIRNELSNLSGQVSDLSRNRQVDPGSVESLNTQLANIRGGDPTKQSVADSIRSIEGLDTSDLNNLIQSSKGYDWSNFKNEFKGETDPSTYGFLVPRESLDPVDFKVDWNKPGETTDIPRATIQGFPSGSTYQQQRTDAQKNIDSLVSQGEQDFDKIKQDVTQSFQGRRVAPNALGIRRRRSQAFQNRGSTKGTKQFSRGYRAQNLNIT